MRKFLIQVGPGIGDFMQFSSMAKSIKESDANITVDFLIRSNSHAIRLNQQLLECQDYVDNIYWYSSKSFWHNVLLIIELLFKHYDYGFYRGEKLKSYSSWPLLIMKIIFCRQIVGYGSDYLDIKVTIPDRCHYLKRNALMLKPLNIQYTKDLVTINREKLDNKWLKTQNIPDNNITVGLSLGTNPMTWTEKGCSIKYDVKSWPYFNWCKLAELLSTNGINVVLLGGTKEKEELIQNKIIVPQSANIKNYVGNTTLMQSLSLVSKCNLIVGAEGGMMHTAFALGVKTLTIFGGSDYKRWNPGGSSSEYIRISCDKYPCFDTKVAVECRYHKCLEDLEVDDVFTKIRNVLNV